MNENAQVLKSASRAGMVWGIITLIIGMLAIASPLVTGLAVSLMVAILMIAAGLSMTIFAFQAPSLGRGILKFLFGGLTIIVGLYMASSPGLTLATLTLVLGGYFLADAVLGFIVAWNVKPEPGWGWMTFNSAVTLLLGYMILKGWPVSGVWAVGILVGVRFLFSGITMFTLGSAGTQVAKSMSEMDPKDESRPDEV